MSDAYSDIVVQAMAMLDAVARLNVQMADQAEEMVRVFNARFPAGSSAAGNPDAVFDLLRRYRAAIGPAVDSLRRHMEALELLDRLMGKLLSRPSTEEA